MGILSRIRGWLGSPDGRQQVDAEDETYRDSKDEFESVRIAIAGWRAPFEASEFLDLIEALMNAVAEANGHDEGHEVSLHHPLEAQIWIKGPSAAAITDAATPVLMGARMIRTAQLFRLEESRPSDAAEEEPEEGDLVETELRAIDRTTIEAEVPAGLSLLDAGLRGIALHREGRYPEALAYFNSVLRLAPDHAETWYCRGVLHSTMCNPSKAVEDFTHTLELAPEHEMALVNRGAEKDEQGDYQGAMSDYDTALRINDQNVIALANRGNTRHRIGDRRGACQDWHKALELGYESVRERLAEHCKGGSVRVAKFGRKGGRQ